MNEATKFEQIEAYINDELTGTALAEFEAQLNGDPSLRMEVELHRDVDIALMGDEDIPFVQTLNEIHKEATTTPEKVIPAKEDTSENLPPPKPPIRRIIRYAIAAAAAVLLLVLFRFLPFSTSPDIVQLSENTIGSPPALLDAGRGTPDAEALVVLYQKIKDGQPAEAIPQLTEIYEKTGDNQAALGLGYCHLQVKNYDNAIQIFEQLEAQNSDLSGTATWYLAHTHLRNDDIKETKHILQKIISDNSVTLKRREQAKKLLNDLGKIN